MELQRIGHDWATSLSLFTFMHWRRKWQPTPVFLPGESQGRRSLVGCPLWGRTESDTTSDLAAAAGFKNKKSRCNSVQSLSCVRLFATQWIAARQASLSITNSRSSPKTMSIESVMPSSHLILCRSLVLLPQSFPALGSFPMSQLFAWGGQSIGVSASISTYNKSKDFRY